MDLPTSQMNKYRSRSAIVAVLLSAALYAQAQEAGRVDQLEKEIQDIKSRLNLLESARGTVSGPKSTAPSDGWKSLSAWRQLKTGMSLNEVRAILGEPSRINGGEIANWYYANGGVSIFMGEKLYRWTEPK